MRCTKCEFENPAGMKFCGKCRTALGLTCSNCSFENPPGFDFCGQCAAALQGDTGIAKGKSAPEKPAAAVRVAAEQAEASTLEGERKTVTALFADIKGSTELEQDLDPEEARAIVDPALKLMIDAVQRYDGYVVQSTGDGIFAIFGAPVAHEDHPQRALYAALRMQEELHRYSDKLLMDGRAPLETRVGVNTGEVVVRSISTGGGHVEYTPIGHTTNLASRMQALAPTGSIAISEPTRRLVEGYFALKPRGPTRVKGVSEPVNVYEVTGLGPLRSRLQRSAARGYTRFVGRDREIGAIKQAAEQSRAGHGQIVAAVADAGVGKSRLFFEFKAASRSGWLVLEALSFSHGKATAYLPLIDLLHSYFKISDEDDQRARRAKVTGNVLTLDRTLEDTLSYLFGLLGIVEGEDPLVQMDAEIRQRRTQEAVKRVLLRESLNQPLMLVFEDLHWIDPETKGFLNLLAEGMANARVLLLVNYRPEYSHHWGGKTYYTQLRLDPLGKESADEMLAALIGDDAQLAPLKRLITEKTAGNPLFIEELVGALFDEGVLVRNGVVKLTRPTSQLKIPPTLQGILAARIDRLQPEGKDLLQTLAVIGMEFPFSLAREVAQLPTERLDSLLSGLQSGEFIFEQPAAGDIDYTFKHALTHDVAYGSILAERRRALHERTAQAIEALYVGALEDHYAELAHHYRASGNTAKAIEYLCLAAEQAVGRGAYAQALANVEPALQFIQQLPEGKERLQAELGVRLLQGRIVSVLYGLGSEERLQSFKRVCELSEQLGNATTLLRGLVNLGFWYSTRGETLRAREIAPRCIELAKQNTNEISPVVTCMLAGTAWRSGDLVQALLGYRDSMKRFVSANDREASEFTAGNLWAITPGLAARVQLALGRPDEALKLLDEAIRRARQIKHTVSLSAAISQSGWVRFYRREPQAVCEVAEMLIGLTEEQGMSKDRMANAHALHGWAMTQLGQTEKGIGELEEACDSAEGVLRLLAVQMLAQAYALAGRTDRAVAMIEEALAGVERSGARSEAPELYRLKGEAILALDGSAVAAAETCLRKSIEIAQGQSAKWWELRATTSLARLLRDTDRRDEARGMLADIYNWFTEGFDTADLKDAEALLEELNA